MVDRLFRVIISRKARRRLKEIGDYHREYASEEVCKKVRNKIIEQAEQLERNPERYTLLPGTEDMDYEVRYTKAWSYKIIFRIFPVKQLVRILTIFLDKQDPRNIRKDLE